MKKSLFLMLMFYAFQLVAAKNPCLLQVPGYKVLKNTVFPFVVGKDSACFFAYYTINPDPYVDTKGSGNPGDSIWYAFYLQKKPAKIYEFPRPNDTFWSIVCNVDAVSFIDIDDDGVRDVTVIGSCNKNVFDYKYPFVFLRQGDHYVFDKDVYMNLMDTFGLTVADVHAYIQDPEKYLQIIKHRSDGMPIR